MEAEKKFHLTKSGLEKIKQELEELKSLKKSKVGGRDEAPEVLHSEELNPDYLYFLEDLKFLENRINELEYIVKNSETINPSAKKKETIDVGATVLVEVGGQDDQLTIVETLEANPELGQISKESPVGQALLGGRKGDKIVVSSPIKTTYKIKKIDYHLS
jgi:transcription elongation factor GreA